MRNKKLIVLLFVAMAAIQLYVPGQMILGKQDVLKNGKEFKFKTRPIDPNDPFRGKYIILNFQGGEFLLDSAIEWTYPEQFYAVVNEDEQGFAEISNISVEAPTQTQDYFLVQGRGSNIADNGTLIFLEYPFGKFFMEESKAYEAEVAVRESSADTTQITYALVAVKAGDSALKDVFINDVPLREVVLNRRRSQE